MRPRGPRARLWLPALLVALPGCTLFGYPSPWTPAPPRASGRSSPAAGAPNPASVPDAVPRAEPLIRSANPPEYTVRGHTYHVLKSAKGYVAVGIASWYGPDFQGRLTTSGEPYDMYQMTAAHKTLPIPSYVEVTNLANGKKVVVRVNDRGPFVKNRLIDLSYMAALKLGIVGPGTAKVRVRALPPWGKRVP